MRKATWYYAKGREDLFAQDVRDLVRCGVRTVLFNSPDDATTRTFVAAADGEPIDLHTGVSLAELYRLATGQDAPKMVIPQLDEFTARFGERVLPHMTCWSSVSNPSPMAAWLVETIGQHGFAKGISMDVIRYMNTVFWEDFPCECDACRTRREPWLGHGVLSAEDRTDPSVMHKEVETKIRVITNIARSLAAAVKDQGLTFSIAARSVYAGRDTENAAAPMWGYGPAVYEGQDWPAWCHEGILDTIHFMNYSPRLPRFERLAHQHRTLLEGSGTIHHEGLGVKSSAGAMTPEVLQQEIDTCRVLGVDGVTIFPWHGMTDAHFEVLAGV